MDQGVIQSLKVNYRKLLLRKRLQAIDDEIEFKINLLDALHLIRRSWDMVGAVTISKCFRKAGFIRIQNQNMRLHGFEGINLIFLNLIFLKFFFNLFFLLN
jgi:hypothetical protein